MEALWTLALCRHDTEKHPPLLYISEEYPPITSWLLPKELHFIPLMSCSSVEHFLYVRLPLSHVLACTSSNTSMALDMEQTDILGCWIKKIAGGVSWATENWTQKDRGENGILGPKRSNFVRICTQKIVFVLVDEKKHPKKIEFGTQRLKKGVKTAAHMYHPSYREYPPPPPPPTPRGMSRVEGYGGYIWDRVRVG